MGSLVTRRRPCRLTEAVPPSQTGVAAPRAMVSQGNDRGARGLRRRYPRPAIPPDRHRPDRSARRVAVALALWAGWYAAYRFYYGFGGHLGMIGRHSPAQHLRRDNVVGGAIILLAALLPSIAVIAWRQRPVRRLVPLSAGWRRLAPAPRLHADDPARAQSDRGASGPLPPRAVAPHDRRQADLQDLLINEPWFFVEGCLWALFASCSDACAGAGLRVRPPRYREMSS